MILYDGIGNSVFDGQVVEPLRQRLRMGEYYEVIIISFEANQVHSHVQKKLPDRIKLICLPKQRFLGRWSLMPSVWHLKHILRSLQQPYDLIARGPIAGLVALNAQTFLCHKITIQVRGLLAEEYRYTTRTARYLTKIIHQWRTYLFENLERHVYQICSANNHHCTLEAVSGALKDYLIQKYNIPFEHITVAIIDKPTSISEEQKQLWRAAVRMELNLPSDAYVFCYNGSAKPWQCPQETLLFYQQQTQQQKNAYLLVLTNEPKTFKRFVEHMKIDEKYISILSVKHTDIYRYLAACDEGIVLREPHILNWISRPTKVLEYQAVGLKIAHNNTIGMLTEMQTEN